MRRLFFVIALALPSAGFTDCQYFGQVPIATNESTPPIVGARMWVDGAESIRPGDSYTYSSTGDIVIVPFVYDNGGAWVLNLHAQEVEVFCHDYDADPEESQVTRIVFFDEVASQPPGQPGELRSNGLYTVADITDLSSYEWYCHPGFDLETVTYSWRVAGRDYSGNEAGALGTVVYAP